ncbi:MAG: LolA-like putative outer membrane lipoprotein chaperone [Bacteroidaceae bacterium]
MGRIFIIIASILCMNVQAQDARKILDATAAKIRKSGDIQVSFIATSFNGSEEQSRTEGVMLLKGKMLHMDTPEMKTWYDGTTLWSYMPESGEVNVSTPTEKEMSVMNPYSFLNAYKKGYRLSAKESNLRGQNTYEVHMLARYAGYLAQEVYLDIRRSDYTPLCVRVKQDGNWSRIAIQDFKGELKLNNDSFRFDASQYPDVEVIDLR